jgi:hypothetical protein
MALWGNKDNLNIGAAGTVFVSNWDTLTVTGNGTTFTNFEAGDVIRFGDFKGTYYGDAVIASIASTISCTIASSEGLDPNLGVFATGYGATTFVVSQLPKSSTSDSSYKEPEDGYTKAVYAVNATNIDATSGTGIAADSAGWVGVTTYLQSDGTLRTKSEVLVAMSGISTGGRPKFPTPLDLA